MVEIVETHEFARWIDNLRDRIARVRIQARIDRLIQGLAGDVKAVGEGVSEMKIDYGPGYRVYFIQQSSVLIVLLAGGDKDTQSDDIKAAMKLARELK